MSDKLPVVSGKDLIKFFLSLGYYVRGQEGSHVHLRHPNKPPLTIPNHKEIGRGTLRAIIRQAGLPRNDFKRMI